MEIPTALVDSLLQCCISLVGSYLNLSVCNLWPFLLRDPAPPKRLWFHPVCNSSNCCSLLWIFTSTDYISLAPSTTLTRGPFTRIPPISSSFWKQRAPVTEHSIPGTESPASEVNNNLLSLLMILILTAQNAVCLSAIRTPSVDPYASWYSHSFRKNNGIKSSLSKTSSLIQVSHQL